MSRKKHRQSGLRSVPSSINPSSSPQSTGSKQPGICQPQALKTAYLQISRAAVLGWTMIGGVATLVTFFQVRPILQIATPVMMNPDESPQFADFVISNLGQLPAQNLSVTCEPTKTVFSNEDTFTVRDADLEPFHTAATLGASSSFTGRYAPLVQLTTFSKPLGMRVYVVGQNEMCLLFRPTDGNTTTIHAQSCPIKVEVDQDSREDRPRLKRAELVVKVRYHWPFLKWLPLEAAQRFLVVRNDHTNTFVWEPMALSDPEITTGRLLDVCLGHGCPSSNASFRYRTAK